jgi:hypothetical protein
MRWRRSRVTLCRDSSTGLGMKLFEQEGIPHLGPHILKEAEYVTVAD